LITFNREVPLRRIHEKLARKVLSHEGSLMMAETHFRKGGVGELHKHEAHEQLSYLVRGKLELELEGQKTVLREGDSFYVKPGILHRVVILEDALVLDVFTPVFEEWLK